MALGARVGELVLGGGEIGGDGVCNIQTPFPGLIHLHGLSQTWATNITGAVPS